MALIINSSTYTPRDQNESDWLYNGLDCCVTFEVLNKLLPQLDNVSHSTYDFARDMQGPILEMTYRGLLVDRRRREAVLAQCYRDIERVRKQLARIVIEGVGCEWWRTPASASATQSWRSTADLQTLFYNVLGFTPIKKRRANGTYTVSVDRSALEKLALNLRAAPLCSRILLLHDLDKKRQRLEAPLDADGRERTSLNIAGTNTGRLSSALSDFGTGGNQQNIDRDLREVYTTDPGMKFANFDLEQGDSRNVGACCWERFYHTHGETFAAAYLNACESKDLHTTVARMTFPSLDWGPEPNWRSVADVLYYRNDSYRQVCKKLGHATNFDGTPKGVAPRVKIEKKLVEEFQERYFTAFPCVKERIAAVKRELLNSQTITNLFGFRRIFFGDPKAGETQREGCAFEPQSMTARQINQGILQLFRARAESRWDFWFHLQVHDSLLVQYPEQIEDEFIPWALKHLRVPLTLTKNREFVVPVEAKIGWNWGDVQYDKQGKVIANPLGLIKWKGGDTRKR